MIVPINIATEGYLTGNPISIATSGYISIVVLTRGTGGLAGFTPINYHELNEPEGIDSLEQALQEDEEIVEIIISLVMSNKI